MRRLTAILLVAFLAACQTDVAEDLDAALGLFSPGSGAILEGESSFLEDPVPEEPSSSEAPSRADDLLPPAVPGPKVGEWIFDVTTQVHGRQTIRFDVVFEETTYSIKGFYYSLEWLCFDRNDARKRFADAPCHGERIVEGSVSCGGPDMWFEIDFDRDNDGEWTTTSVAVTDPLEACPRFSGARFEIQHTGG